MNRILALRRDMHLLVKILTINNREPRGIIFYDDLISIRKAYCEWHKKLVELLKDEWPWCMKKVN